MTNFDDASDLPFGENQGSKDNTFHGEREISRRRLLKAGSFASLALTLFGPVKAASYWKKKADTANQAPSPSSGSLRQISWRQHFSEPRVVYSDRERTVGENLRVSESDITMPSIESDGRVVMKTRNVRAYNSEVPGPTFKLFPGDKLEFKVFNELPKNAPVPDLDDSDGGMLTSCKAAGDKDVPHCFNTTNVHFHGLHVSPITTGDDPKTGVSSDDVHVRIPPKDDDMDNDGWPSERQYRVQLPAFHAPGTHWYHAHVHGSTAIQVANGMAGALIIEEPEDQEIQVDKDLIWMIQEIIGNGDEGNDFDQVYSRVGPGLVVNFTVNSFESSEIRMRPNEIHRWRFINATATPRGFMNVAIRDEQGRFVQNALHLIAVDGITFYGKDPQPVTDPGHFMSPANRADFLIRLPKGTFKVFKGEANPGGQNPTKDQELATIFVDGPDMPFREFPALPGVDKRPCYLTPITDEELEAKGNRVKKLNLPPIQGNF